MNKLFELFVRAYVCASLLNGRKQNCFEYEIEKCDCQNRKSTKKIFRNVERFSNYLILSILFAVPRHESPDPMFAFLCFVVEYSLLKIKKSRLRPANDQTCEEKISVKRTDAIQQKNHSKINSQRKKQNSKGFKC